MREATPAVPRLRLGRLVASAAIAATAAWAAPSAAHALTVDVAANVPRAFGATVTASPTDPAGEARLVLDGSAVATAAITPGESVAFPGVGALPGPHRLSAIVVDATGTMLASATPVAVTVWGRPSAPGILSPAGTLAAMYIAPRAVAGSWTTSMSVHFGYTRMRAAACVPGQRVYFGVLPLPGYLTTVTVVSSNPFGETSSASRRVRRLTFPWLTCLVVDKSERRIYWVKGGILIKVYRCAIGKPSTPTPERIWKVGAKERTDPYGVYGPRKLRLYKKVGSSYIRTRYGIHGTNEPWVIGTMASHGCIRMYNSQILELWPQVPYGTMVQTRR